MSGLHGSARWADLSDLKAAGLLDPGDIYLGTFGNNQTRLYHSGEEHVFTLAPPGTGKTAGVAIPSLLLNSGSMVVTDPKGALTAQTARYRRDTLGHKIVVLNPWRDELIRNSDFGLDLGSTGFNPLYQMTADNPDLIDDAEFLAGLICPTPRNVNDEYWTKTARDIISALLLFMVYSPDYKPTLPNLYRLARSTNEGWLDIVGKMVEITETDLTYRANEIYQPMESPKQWAGVVSAMKDATSIYDPAKSLAAHVEKDEFDPRDLKRENVTVYIVATSNRRKPNAQWLALVTELLAQAVGQAGKAKRVTFLIEEFQNLGLLPSIATSMAEYREAGLRVHIITQTIEALRTIYGKDEAANLINLCGVRQYFGVDSTELAGILEKSIGTYTAENNSYTEGQSIGDSGTAFPFGNNPDDDPERHKEFLTAGRLMKQAMFGVRNNTITQNTGLSRSVSRSEIAVPLFRAQDILNLPPNHQLIISRGDLPPVPAYVRPYFHDQWMLDATDPNPYRDEPQQRTALPFQIDRNSVVADAGELTETHYDVLTVAALAGAAFISWGILPLLFVAGAIYTARKGHVWAYLKGLTHT